MKGYVILFVILNLGFLMKGNSQPQLVANGNMESYSSCPTSFSAPWDFQIRYCNGWREGSEATSDYYNACAPVVGCVNVPNGCYGYQQAHSGKGYCAIVAYAQGWYEYIQTDLITPMEAGKSYTVSFYVSCADYVNVAVNYLGVYISNQAFVAQGTMPLNVTPQIFPGQYITDTASWVLFSGTYVAGGGENTITIGPFPDINSIDTISMPDPIDTVNPIGYYYIDDVSVTLGEDLQLVNVFSPDNDGINDLLDPAMVTDELCVVSIFDRWGVCVATGDLESFTWDGKKAGTNTDCSDGVYYYVITRQTNEEFASGFIHLIR